MTDYEPLDLAPLLNVAADIVEPRPPADLGAVTLRGLPFLVGPADPTAAGEPSGLLRQALESAFGNMADFRRKFADSAMSRFGAGWAWVAVDHNGEVDILTTPNEDSPIMLGYRPILGLDLWEHAYYLTYPTRREAYIEAFWHLVHWGHVAALYAHCIEMTGRIRSR